MISDGALAYAERKMYEMWVNESNETNEAWLEHLKRCVHVAITDCCTDKQQQYVALLMLGFSGKEIAKQFSVSPTTVSRTLHRAFRNIISRIKYATPRTLTVDEYNMRFVLSKLMR